MAEELLLSAKQADPGVTKAETSTTFPHFLWLRTASENARMRLMPCCLDVLRGCPQNAEVRAADSHSAAYPAHRSRGFHSVARIRPDPTLVPYVESGTVPSCGCS